MSDVIAKNARIRLTAERTVQVQQYNPFKLLLEVSSDCGDGDQTKEDLDRFVENLSDYIMVKFDEEFRRHLEAQKNI